MDIFRRIACAYATHGAPLTYSYRNREALTLRKVYTRVVNTATLARIPGSGGRPWGCGSTLPASGTWSGKRVRHGDVWRDAHTAVSHTGQTIDLEDLTVAPVRRSSTSSARVAVAAREQCR